MINLNVPDRTKAIAHFVQKGSKVIDIGCDHAWLAIYLIVHKIAAKVIASDIRDGALQQGIDNIKKYNLQNKISVRCGDGLDVVASPEIDTIIISGLGGKNIIKILEKDVSFFKNIKMIIIQPNNNIPKVRKSIIALGFYIEKELLLKESGIIYTILTFVKGNIKYSKKELFFGPMIFKNKDDLFYELYLTKLKNLKKLYIKVPKQYILRRLKLKRQIRFLEKNIDDKK